MSEHLENQEETQQQEPEQQVLNPFDEGSWVNETIESESNDYYDNAEASASDSSESDDEQEEVYDADEYLKQNLGFESWEQAKAEIESLRTQKQTIGNYENETSQKLHQALASGNFDEVYSFLEQDRKISKILDGDVTVENAEDIVKLAMKNKYQNLTDDEINYKFNKTFAFPKKPEQSYDETDSEFEDRMTEWEDKVNDIKMELMIEAKSLKPEVESLRQQIKLPTVSDQNAQEELTQEELELVDKYLDSYYSSAESAVNSFDGFSVEYKDEAGVVQTAYVPSVEEKEFVASQLEMLAESNFNANTIFAERWVKDDGSLNTSQITRDLALLYSEEKIMQKLVNDGISKRMADYRKQTSNIKVNGGQANRGGFPQKGNDQSQMAEFFFNV